MTISLTPTPNFAQFLFELLTLNSSVSRKWLIKHLFPPSSCKKQINKHNSYLLLAFLQSGSVPELDMHESKHFCRVSLYTVNKYK
jgi:hypothetical protein